MAQQRVNGTLLIAWALLSNACASAPKGESPAAAIPHRSSVLPQLGLRIASSSESANLLAPISPASCTGDGSAGVASVPLASLPLPYTHSPGPELDRPTPSLDATPAPYLMAYYGAPVAYSEVGLVSPQDPHSLRVSETRFLHEIPALFFQEYTDSWSNEFRMVLDSAPMRPPGVADPVALVEGNDPLVEERDHSAWLRGQKNLRGSARDGAKETRTGSLVLDQLRDWRNQPLNFFLALMGGGLEQETPEGGKLIFGPQLSELSTADSPAQLFKVRYLLGPFEARAQTREAWARYRTEVFGCSLILRTAYSYLRQDQSYQLVLSRPVAETTSLRMIGGSGLGSESLTGFSPYPEDPREERRVALLLVLDHRF